MADKKTYMLKSLPAGARAHGGFVWPTEPGAEVVAPDWDQAPRRGGGLHGALDGEGQGSLFCWDSNAVWIAAEIPAGEAVIDLGGKIKVRRVIIRCAGDRETVTAWLRERLPHAAIIGGTATAGDDGTATAGDHGTATAGDHGTATAGDHGTATAGIGGTATAGIGGTATAGIGGTATAGRYGTSMAGNYGTATAGDRGTATVGDRGTATVGDEGTATAGIGGTAMAGNYGTATAGDRGTATVGDRGTATVGDRGTATVGEYGTAMAGEYGEIHIRWHDGNRYRLAVGYVGEGGVEANVPYVVRDGKLVRHGGAISKAKGGAAR